MTTDDEIAAYLGDHSEEAMSFTDICEAFEHIEPDVVWEAVYRLVREERVFQAASGAFHWGRH